MNDPRGVTDPSPAVTLRGVTKRFPGVVANAGVDLEIHAGEVHALLGENGAGKSTLSNIITGLYRPDEGSLELHGEPVQLHSPRDALTRGVGMVHQHFRLVQPFTVAENIALGDQRDRRLVPTAPRSSAASPRSPTASAWPSTRVRASGSSRSASSSAWRSSRRSTATRAS